MEFKSKEELQHEMDQLCEVNLIDFLTKVYGYQIDENKTKKEHGNLDNHKYVFLKNDNDMYMNGYPSELIVSKTLDHKGNKPYLYTNIFDDSDKGNIFNFIKKREGEKYSIPYSKKKIYNYLKNVDKGFYKEQPILKSIDTPLINTKEQEKRLQALADQYKLLPKLKHYEYLESRGLSLEILKSDMLKNRIRNEYIYEKQGLNQVNNIKHINTIFPLYNYNEKTKDGEFCGYVRKNKGFKVNTEDSMSSKGLWISQFNKKDKIDKLIICENPIDGISYMQMNLDWKNSKNVIIATNGEVSERHLQLAQIINERLKPNQIILANDNCVSGQAFNAKFLAHLSFSDKQNNQINLIQTSHLDIFRRKPGDMSEIVWRFTHDSNKEQIKQEDFIYKHIAAFQKVCENYQSKNEEFYNINDQKEPFIIEKQFNLNESYIKISFFKSIENWQVINESLLELRHQNSEKLKIEIPKLKDFNEDLQFQLSSNKLDNKQLDINNNINFPLNN